LFKQFKPRDATTVQPRIVADTAKEQNQIRENPRKSAAK